METLYIVATTTGGKKEYIALPTGGVAPHNQAWSTITDRPSTLAGYGITDGGEGMTYPTDGIALSTGAAWGTSIINNSANWNTAYGWGNHATAGYAPLASPTFTGIVDAPTYYINGKATVPSQQAAYTIAAAGWVRIGEIAYNGYGTIIITIVTLHHSLLCLPFQLHIEVVAI
jgi:hypothetical protein